MGFARVGSNPTLVNIVFAYPFLRPSSRWRENQPLVKLRGLFLASRKETGVDIQMFDVGCHKVIADALGSCQRLATDQLISTSE
ncbi:hypothetical protein BDU57DRAFT_521757 [Ampelomyces quisqualis]|uniref:Uncharacterized protein n=1 Tax=Ampelomyces quisqualis TaxID=50730 RepID=A0A6A5QCH2_AMPQU|nr:hypothetical protein BDU57DRAFT_521757 [Ampelomyces quisqualis]